MSADDDKRLIADEIARCRKEAETLGPVTGSYWAVRADLLADIDPAEGAAWLRREALRALSGGKGAHPDRWIAHQELSFLAWRNRRRRGIPRDRRIGRVAFMAMPDTDQP